MLLGQHWSVLEMFSAVFVRLDCMVFEIGGKQANSCCFQDLFKTSCSIFAYFPSSLFSMHFVSAQVVHTCNIYIYIYIYIYTNTFQCYVSGWYVDVKNGAYVHTLKEPHSKIILQESVLIIIENGHSIHPHHINMSILVWILLNKAFHSLSGIHESCDTLSIEIWLRMKDNIP